MRFRSLTYLFTISALLLLLFSCSPTRRLQPDEYLLVKNKVSEIGKHKPKDNIPNYIQQRPNRKFLGFWRFYLQVYNAPNPDKLALKKKKQLERIDEKNKKILAYNETQTNPKKKKKLKKERLLFGEWLQKIGEPPVVLDSFITSKSVIQLTRYAQSQGYFHATVRDSTVLNPKKQQATVYYKVDRGEPYFIDSIRYEISDPSIDFYVQSTMRRTVLKDGMQYNLDKIDEERERITRLLQNRGYYLFRQEFIKFTADTSVGDRKINLVVNIADPQYVFEQNGDTIRVNKHKKFTVSKIYVISDYKLRDEASKFTDSIDYNNYTFLYNGKLNYNKKILAQAIFFEKDSLYRPSREDRTQRAFSELRNFKYINIRYEPVFTDGENDQLRAYIELSPTPKQNLTTEFQGTNTEGNLGVSLSLGYQNKNIFKGAELLEFRVYGGAEIQVIQGDSADIDQTTFGPFNTLEFGVQVSLTTPRFLFPINMNRIKKWAKPKSRITLSFNYQGRPDYRRFVASIIFGYEWNQTTTKRHVLNPIEISVIQIDPTQAFQDFINQIDDQFVRNSFRNHYIQGLSYTFTFNNQQIRNRKDFIFFRFNAQTGGNVNSLISLIGQDDTISGGKHTVFGIQYAQYARTDFDFRFYKFMGRKKSHSLNFRAFVGVGLPYGNSTVLPFEKSYFIGGANDLRAWLPRTLGPGSYQQVGDGRVDQVGDIKLLANVEYRFTMYKFLEGAVFADFGNIWLIRSDKDRPQGEFRFDRFWNEFAFGTGVGVRLNFGFFIFRVDVALPFRDPTKPAGERWVVSKLKGDDVRVNIGIGYPF